MAYFIKRVVISSLARTWQLYELTRNNLNMPRCPHFSLNFNVLAVISTRIVIHNTGAEHIQNNFICDRKISHVGATTPVKCGSPFHLSNRKLINWNYFSFIFCSCPIYILGRFSGGVLTDFLGPPWFVNFESWDLTALWNKEALRFNIWVRSVNHPFSDWPDSEHTLLLITQKPVVLIPRWGSHEAISCTL